jgi:hypothetical protein
MKLKQFCYKEFYSQTNNWELDVFTLNDKVNLLVGKNATGKTRTIDRISALAGLLIGQPQLSLEIIESADFEACLIDKNDKYIYSLATRDRNIASEMLTINDVTKLKRFNDGSGEIFYEEQNKSITFKVSDNWPIITYRRDSIQHPFLENMFKWAEGLRCYYFGSSREMGQKNMLATVNLEEFTNGDFNPHETSRINELYLRAKKEYGNDFNNEVIKIMQIIGYDISDLTVEPNPNKAVVEEDRSPLYMLCVNENDRNAKLYQTGMSQGMFRALSLIIQITYNIHKNISSTILIDDIGEGLDYDRSTKLIRQLIEWAEKNDNIQLIMSTNDRFVMNNVPLEYWQVIQRIGGECHIFNYQNSQKIFDDFVYTGLNNFDFLATDFYRERKIG